MENVNITIECQFLVRNCSSTKVVVNVEKQVVFVRPVSATPYQKGIFFVWKGKQIFLYIAHVHLYYGLPVQLDALKYVFCVKVSGMQQAAWFSRERPVTRTIGRPFGHSCSDSQHNLICLCKT